MSYISIPHFSHFMKYWREREWTEKERADLLQACSIQMKTTGAVYDLILFSLCSSSSSPFSLYFFSCHWYWFFFSSCSLFSFLFRFFFCVISFFPSIQQTYADEGHELTNVLEHVYKSMEHYLKDCLSLDPDNTKSEDANST